MASERVHIPIDKFGRVVLPKEIRDRLGVRPGTEFEVEEQEDRILLKPVAAKAKLVEKNGWMVFQTGESVTQKMIDETIDRIRAERGKRFW